MRQPPSVDAWGGGGFRVSGDWRPGSLLIIDDQPKPWTATSLEALTPDDFAEVFAAGGAVEFVLLGCGLVNALPPRSVRDALKAAGLGLEFMSTEGAARTYNVLASEGRRLAAALIAV
ncbi:Mth938-like domain-containing protein [Caulobacter sp. DWP3-1-3b2]|uniref:Mth938-like domain-containing protein n=1 Tax=Caulobacter sp. DWP3-1-3b2 TaxID=2804643 RepID=UPI003CE6C2D8